MATLRDGLGGEEVSASGLGLAVNPYFAGSLFATAGVKTNGTLSGATLNVTNAVASTTLSGTNVNVTTATAVNVSGTTAVRSALVNATNVIGTTAVSGATANFTNVVASTALSGPLVNLGNAVVAGSVDVPTVYDNTGSPYAQGNVYTSFTAETVITGGMWVTVSGAAGGATMVARAAAASTVPIGVATATAASGATVNILTRGCHYFTAEASLNNGVQFAMGAGGALNTIKAVAAGTGRGTVLAGAGSEGLALCYLF